MEENNDIRQFRVEKLERMKKSGKSPFSVKPAKQTHYIKEVLEKFEDIDHVGIAGRIMTIREHGGSTFADIFDGTDRMQVYLKKNEIGNEEYKFFLKNFDMGDFAEFTGTVFVTKMGEKTLKVDWYDVLTKTLAPLPDKWHGIKDDDIRYRKRYLDVLMNPELRKIFELKSKFWEATRDFMKENGFLEVETPTLEVTTGGAEANPFKTHHNDFDLPVYLRISIGELWQKRLMAAGFPKTFEIGRAYRNEGSSPEHLQEFTNMEFYWAYANYRDGMELTKNLYREIANKVFGTSVFTVHGHTFDLKDEWIELDYVSTVEKETGINLLAATEEEMAKKLDELGVKYEGENRERMTDSLWKYCRKKIAGPAFLINHPKLVSPLAKESPTKPGTVERFQIILAGSEVGNGYSELNDPLDQRERFELQEKLREAGDDEAMMADWEFVDMLEHGMPPTCGFGFGERMFAFMVGKPLREVTLFPLMKPEIQTQERYDIWVFFCDGSNNKGGELVYNKIRKYLDFFALQYETGKHRGFPGFRKNLEDSSRITDQDYKNFVNHFSKKSNKTVLVVGENMKIDPELVCLFAQKKFGENLDIIITNDSSNLKILTQAEIDKNGKITNENFGELDSFEEYLLRYTSKSKNLPPYEGSKVELNFKNKANEKPVNSQKAQVNSTKKFSLEDAQKLLLEWVPNEKLRTHMEQVSGLMKAWAESQGFSEEEVLNWELAGLLHDADWEKHPDVHPAEIVKYLEGKVSPEIISAIETHAPHRTGKLAETDIEKMLFAFDELSGFVHACSLVRPTGYEGMEPKSVKKKLKDKSFAAQVSREDIADGVRLSGIELGDLIKFVIDNQPRN